MSEYLRCWNAAEAARRAGYSAKTARSIGAENLTKPDIQAAIAARLAEIKMSADEVLVRLAGHARGSIQDLLDDENEVDLAGARKRGTLHLVKKLKRRTWTDQDGNSITTLELELYDAQAALVQLGRHHKLFTDMHEVAEAVLVQMDK